MPNAIVYRSTEFEGRGRDSAFACKKDKMGASGDLLSAEDTGSGREKQRGYTILDVWQLHG